MLVMPGLITADPEMYSTLEFVEFDKLVEFLAALPSSVAADRRTSSGLKKAFSRSMGEQQIHGGTAGGSEQSLTSKSPEKPIKIIYHSLLKHQKAV